MTTEQIANEINSLAEDELVSTNDGTHDRDPQFFTWRTWERLDGTRYTTGNRDCGVGHDRQMKFRSAAERRAKIAALQLQMAKSQSEISKSQSRLDSLNRGWDGYQFVGIEEGQRRAAAMQ